MEVKKMLDMALCGDVYLVNAFSTTRELLDLHVLRRHGASASQSLDLGQSRAVSS